MSILSAWYPLKTFTFLKFFTRNYPANPPTIIQTITSHQEFPSCRTRHIIRIAPVTAKISSLSEWTMFLVEEKWWVRIFQTLIPVAGVSSSRGSSTLYSFMFWGFTRTESICPTWGKVSLSLKLSLVKRWISPWTSLYIQVRYMFFLSSSSCCWINPSIMLNTKENFPRKLCCDFLLRPYSKWYSRFSIVALIFIRCVGSSMKYDKK